MTDQENTTKEEQNISEPTEKEPSSFRLIITLGIAGFVSGLVMAGAYLFTKPMIEANKQASIEKAIFKVLPKCTSYKTLQLKNGQLSAFDPKTKKPSGKEEAPKLVYQGFDSLQASTGFAVLGSEIGFADVITILIGYEPQNKNIIGYEVLECKETPGLGDKIFKDADFLKNFVELPIKPEIGFAKKGEKQSANQVEAITGATISSKAVIRLLNKAMNEWETPIDQYLNENANPTTAQKK